MRVVVLVPWRGGDELREQSWDVVRPYLEALGWPLYLGDRPGPWSRAGACNDASEKAGAWDVAVVADADTIPEARPVKSAVSRVGHLAHAIRPHDELWRLTPSGSIAIARKGPGGLEPRHLERLHPGGGLLVISRKAWETVGGYDEHFVGWGHEDSYLNTMLLLKASWDRIRGRAWHLWHPEPSRKTREYRENRRLLQILRQQEAGALRQANARAGWDVGAVL